MYIYIHTYITISWDPNGSSSMMSAQKLSVKQGDHLSMVRQVVLERSLMDLCHQHYMGLLWLLGNHMETAFTKAVAAAGIVKGLYIMSRQQNIACVRSATTITVALAPQTCATGFPSLPACGNPLRNFSRICKIVWN